MSWGFFSSGPGTVHSCMVILPSPTANLQTVRGLGTATVHILTKMVDSRNQKAVNEISATLALQFRDSLVPWIVVSSALDLHSLCLEVLQCLGSSSSLQCLGHYPP